MPMKTNVQMQCPKCGNPIDVDALLVSQFEQSIRKDLEVELLKRESELDEKKNEFSRLAKSLEKEKLCIDELVNSKVKVQLESREEVIRNEVEEEKSLQLLELEKELQDKTKRLKELNGTKAELERVKREKEEAETRITLKKEKELTERLEQVRASVIKGQSLRAFPGLPRTSE